MVYTFERQHFFNQVYLTCELVSVLVLIKSQHSSFWIWTSEGTDPTNNGDSQLYSFSSSSAVISPWTFFTDRHMLLKWCCFLQLWHVLPYAGHSRTPCLIPQFLHLNILLEESLSSLAEGVPLKGGFFFSIPIPCTDESLAMSFNCFSVASADRTNL